MKKVFFILIISFSFLNSKIVVDHNQNEIEIDDRVKRVIVTSGYPIPSIFAVFDGTTKHLVGIPKSSMLAAKHSLLAKIYPDVVNINTAYDSGGNSLNIEEILKLKPDAVFYYADNKINKEQLTNAKIPNVGFGASIFNNNPLKVFDEWIKLMGELTNKNSQAQKIIDFAYETEAKILEKTKNLKDRPVALIIMHHRDGKFTVNGKNHYSQYWLDTTGAINGAKHNGVKEMNLEEFYKINPDIIYITNFNPFMPEDFNKPINGLDFTKIKAVKNGKVYKFPLGMYRWYPPSSDAPLALMWLAKHNQPEIFKDLDMKKETLNFYKKFFGLDLAEDELNSIFNPSREAGNI
ncbi:ABC transporter substrate-binding protein [Campylobacter sp. FMV-PI01]|uniref:ABC transporter substrate-binding protein n=1 Tax=Campylobacter portucalensis TaxID=2608384 RepID=A0A6L5WLB0_9BACT|nr:ABC transporter substrate-binding protein [Campylobacter portucalensis]MSN96603.1 ABC transporter substrate-binding protein [Campylobacter portucalensis]